jgi:PIN domain nuclease of toxin-antitoxin system
LPVSHLHALKAGAYPHPHRDPFDRMLAAQSEIEALPIVGCDGSLQALGVRTVW